MWIVASLVLTALVVMQCEGFPGTANYNPCWYTLCPTGTTCKVVTYPCYNRPCPSYAQCVEVKDDFCPWAPVYYSYLPCVNQCSMDPHCPGEEKCCRIGRCNRCVDAVASPWDRTVTSESASERAEAMAEALEDK